MSHEPKRADFSVPVRINLYSDTQTRPSHAMKEAMMAADVGDEQGGSDPTVWELCDRTAALLGKEAAMFMPSGTMCNQVALATHCRPGDEVLAHDLNRQSGCVPREQPDFRDDLLVGVVAVTPRLRLFPDELERLGSDPAGDRGRGLGGRGKKP